MRKTLLYILAVILLASCVKQPTFDPKAIAEQYVREHTDNLNVISCTAALIHDTTIFSTSYHIAAVDGIPTSDRSWKNVTAVYTDSIRISHVHKPEHYYCCVLSNESDITRDYNEVAVLPDGSAISYNEFCDRYYQSIIDTVYAQLDTITDVRPNIGYLHVWNGWVIKQIIYQYHAPK